MALPNGDLITTVFDPQMAYPVDKRMQVDTLNSRDSISMYIRWEGMTVYVLENSKIYILQGGRSNEFWKELGTGTGTGGTTFVGQFESADLLPTSGRSAGDYAFVGTGDDFVQYNWDNISGQWVMAEGQTDLASEHFHIGYKTPLRRPVIFRRDPKDVIIEDSGSIIVSPTVPVGNFIFTGEVVELVGFETPVDGREIHLTNRTGSDFPITEGATFGFSRVLANSETIAVVSESGLWELGVVNQVAFSDHLDSVNATRSIGPDGLEVITGVYDKHTGVEHQYKEFTGTPPAVDGILFVQVHGKTFINAEYLKTGQINIKTIGCRSEPGFDNSPILNYYLSIPGFNHFIIPETGSPFEIFEIIDIVDRHGLTIEGGHLKVNPSATRQRLHVFEIFDSSDLTFRNLIIEGSGQLETYTEPNARGHGIRIISTSKKVLIDNIRFKNLGSDGIYINDSSGDEACKDISIINSHFNKVTRNGISIINGESIHIDNCTFDDWKLCAIDMEPNAPTSNLPLRDITVSNNVFTKHPGQQSEHRAVVQASTGAASEMDRDLIGNINILHNNFFNNGTIGVSVRTANFKKCRIIGNTMNGAKAASIYLGASYNSTCAFNVIENSYSDSFIDQSPNTGAISVWGSRNIVFGNHIDASSYHGIWCSYTTAIADRNIISNNYINNIGRMENWGGVDFSAIRLNNAANTVLTGNIINDTEETPSTKVGIQITGSNSIGNSVYDNKISDNIATKINLVNVDKQGLVKNNGTEDVLSYGRVVTSLPTASVDVYGKIFKVKASGSNDDQFYLCILNSESGYEWINIFSDPTSGSTTFIGDTDTPETYTNQKNKTLKVNNSEDAVEFVNDGTDVREVSDGGSILLALNSGYIASRLLFSNTEVQTTINGLYDAGGQSTFTVINKTGQPLTIKNAYGPATVKFNIGSDLDIPDNSFLQFEIIGNEIIKSETIPQDVLDEYATKAETYTKTEVDAALSSLESSIDSDLNNYYTKAETDVISSSAYMGPATPATIPNEGLGPQTYSAAESGTYSNFDGIVVDLSEGRTELSFDGSEWKKIVIPIELSGYTTDSGLKEKANNLFFYNETDLFPSANLPVRRYNSSGATDYAEGYNQTATEDGLYISIPQAGVATIRYYFNIGKPINSEITELEFLIDQHIATGGVGIGFLQGGVYKSYILLYNGQWREYSNWEQTNTTVTGLQSYLDNDVVKFIVSAGVIEVYVNDEIAYTRSILASDVLGDIVIAQTGFIHYTVKLREQSDPIRTYVSEQQAEIEDNITEINSIIVDSKNLIDKSKASYGYYDATTGTWTSSTGTVTTEKIRINPDREFLSLNAAHTTNQGARLFWFDENGDYISYLPNTEPVEGIPIPDNAYFVAVKVISKTGGVGDATDNEYINNLQLEYGEESTSFETFGKKISLNALPGISGNTKSIRITVQDADNFTVHSRHDNGEIVSHTWNRINQPDYYDIGWYAPTIIHAGRTIVQGSFNFIHRISNKPNENQTVGHAHGCEVDIYSRFYIDGKEFIVADEIGNTLEGDVFSFDIASEIYAADHATTGTDQWTTPQLPLILSTRHYMNGEIRANSKTRNHNKLVIMRDDVQFGRCYLGMHLGFQNYFDRIQIHNIENTMADSQTLEPIAPSTATPTIPTYDTADGFRGELAHSATSYSDRYGYIFKTICRAGTDEMQQKMTCEVSNLSKAYFHPVITTNVASARGLTADTFNKGDVIEGVIERELIL